MAATCGRPVQPGPPADLPLPEVVRRPCPPDVGARAYEHVARLVSFGGRHTGSPGWQRSLDYIAAEIVRLGLRPVRDRWIDQREKLVFENISVTLPGRSSTRIVIGAHHDTKCTSGHDEPRHNFEFVGANDSGSGVGLLLALAEVWKDADRGATLEIVFFDGEESIPYVWDIDRALFGSRRFVKEYQERIRVRPDEPRIAAFVLLDMVGAADLDIDDEENSDPRLRRIFRRAAEACGHERYFFQREQKVSDDHLPFLQAGIPSIDLIDIADNPQWHTPDDTLEHISARSLQIVAEVVVTALPVLESEYAGVAPRAEATDAAAGDTGRAR